MTDTFTIQDAKGEIAGCCDAWDCTDDIDGTCPDCDRLTSGGTAVTGCNWSPVDCKTCGARPCDGSC